MSIEAMKQALEALENVRSYDKQDLYRLDEDITALRTAIEQAEKQRIDQNLSDHSLAIRTRQYANGAQAGWNLAIAGDSVGLRHLEDFARAVEARLTHTTKTW
jgi:hypothetical protein